MQLFPWGDYHQKQAAAIEAGTLPDAMLGVSVSQQGAMGILSDVSDTFAEIGATGGGFYEPDQREVTIGGKQVAIPFHNEPQFFYYRQDILGPAGFEAPLTSIDRLSKQQPRLPIPPAVSGASATHTVWFRTATTSTQC